jgi:hypothetical protein
MKINNIHNVIIVSIIWCLIFSCKENTVQNFRPIVMNDTSTIVTETDSTYLKNVVEDISIKKKESQTIATTLQQIDLSKKQDALKDNKVQDQTNGGTKVELEKGCYILLSRNVTVTKSGNKIILHASDAIDNMQLKVIGLENSSIQQRTFTNLAVTINGVDYLLEDLPLSTGNWVTLPNTNNLFISLDKTAYSFMPFNNAKLVLATDRALRKAGKGRIELENAKKLIAKIKTANDNPCKIIFNSCQWQINGTLSGKGFQKTMQLEVIK